MRSTSRWSALVSLGALLAGCTSDDAGRQADPGGDGSSTASRVELAQTEAVAEGVTVTGSGEARVEPDTLQVVIGAEVTADTVDTAMSDANRAAQDVIDALGDAGVPDEDIRTRELTLREERHEPQPPGEEPSATRSEPAGYLARNLVEVRLDATDESGDVLQAALDAAGDAARLQELRFAVSDPVGAEASAREAAFRSARDAAEGYADLAGVTLGALVAVRETSGGSSPRPALDAAEAAVPIEPGQHTVTVDVTATWSLED